MPLMNNDFVILLQKLRGNLIGNESVDISNKVSGCVIALQAVILAYKKGYPIQIGK